MAGNSADYVITPELVENVQEAGREILTMGYNPKFVRKRGEVMTDREVCAAMLNEAKKIVALGYNAKFGCTDPRLLKEAEYAQRHRDREKGEKHEQEQRR